ncbi:1-carboxy-3-chloro-3,4-dihydroxycyclo hexa-1,5-diene dehydrogenase [Bacillus sp. J14TS2]|uniref:Gfo/Idh/MocA family protein n=1 Tax=Bacillus sp. J14TS2 TaxID=2807188 RepID=UPI001B2A547F|nr:Gfo/Idh/MocA family oxidoreductase [Bacillus sp. J14TS2]GIN70874.1 1-carboxy-3-chloro-3,4-dihydroxycyclo hexa-1,5-diene dehydrogenase [Bacillus sp. J14TS2]
MISQQEIRVGIIGTGFMGKAHATGYKMFDINIGMIASKSMENAKKTANDFGVENWTNDWRELVANPNIDCVDITVPNHLHYEIAMACIKEKKPFLIEKPLARNAKEAREIVAAAKENGVLALYGENMRFKPALVKIKEIIDQGGLGDIIMLRSNEVHNGPFHSKWFWDADLTGGGAVIDMGIHGLYTLEWIMNSKIKRIYAETGTLKWDEYCKNGAEDSAVIIVRFENGGMAELIVSWAITGGMDVRLEVFGKEGTAYVSTTHDAGGLRVHSHTGYGKSLEELTSLKPHVTSNQGWSFPSPNDELQQGHAYEVKHFIDCVKGLDMPKSTLEQGLRALELVEAVYESARKGQPVELAAKNNIDQNLPTY